MAADANPFSFGDIVSGVAFTDRVEEVARLVSDLRSGQNVAIIGPRRLGKSSLIEHVATVLRADGVLVGSCDLFFTPSKEKLAQRLAGTITADLARWRGDLRPAPQFV